MHPPTQATIRQFDATTRSGSVLFDDGSELPFGAEAYARGGLLNLRLGQRVRLVMRDSGGGREIYALTILTLAFPAGVDVPDPASTEG